MEQRITAILASSRRGRPRPGIDSPPGPGIPGEALLAVGGSWVVISGVISSLVWLIIIVTLLITPLITTHEPPSKLQQRPLLFLNP